MKFKEMPNFQHITYRVCDEDMCRQVAHHVYTHDKGPNEYEKHLCETHYLRYKAELKDSDVKSNS